MTYDDDMVSDDSYYDDDDYDEFYQLGNVKYDFSSTAVACEGLRYAQDVNDVSPSVVANREVISEGSMNETLTYGEWIEWDLEF